MTNKKLGNDFETELCNILYEHGYWVHNFASKECGQPADIIAIQKSNIFLIDCKVCSSKGFALSRVEENQRQAMRAFTHRVYGSAWFACKVGEHIYMLPFNLVSTLVLNGLSYLSNRDIETQGAELNRWLESYQ